MLHLAPLCTDLNEMEVLTCAGYSVLLALVMAEHQSVVTRVRALRAKTIIFSAIFEYVWPLAGPNIAQKGLAASTTARGDRHAHFGTFKFW